MNVFLKKIICLALMLMAVMADSAQSRTDVQLNDGWTIRPISDPSPGKQGTLVTLPHTWNANYVKGTFYNRETMVYTRSLNVSNEMLREHRVFLRFEGVNSVADVFVNRKTAGQHKGGYTAFCMEVTDLLHEGDNELEVWVGNAFRTDVLPIAGDFNVYGGIHRPVHLLITAKDCISPTDYASSGVYVHQEKVSRTVKMNKRGLSTRQIQTAIDRMSRQGGGTVIVPDGQWTSGRIELKSGVCLHLSDSAVLTFSGRISDYQPAVPTRNEGYDVMSLGAMIYANGAENIGLTGRGHIVGPSTDCEIYQENRKYLVVEECVDVTKPIAERLCDGQQGHPVLLPMTVAPVHCKNVLIEGITIDQGLFWNIVPQYCDNVIIRGVTVNSAGHGRTDGIDIESTTNSLIEYCQLDCGDDCYTIKSGRGEDGVRTACPSVGCVIRHSVALRGGGGLVLGSETAASMWNIYMHDCRFEGTEQGIRIKTRRPRGGGAHDVWVERVMARNIKWNGLTVDMLGSKKWVGELANRFPARQVNELTPEFKNIYIKDFTVDGCQRLIDVKALPERPLTNVLIENFEGHGKDFLRLQDVSGFVMKGGKIHTAAPSAVLDGCQSVMLLDMDFNGKQLKQITNNATLYVTQPCLSSKSF